MPMISGHESAGQKLTHHLDAYRRCELCEHRCLVDRTAGETGFCKAGATANLFRHRVEYGEELELVPSHLFYLSGCDLRCGFCIAGINAFDPGRGVPLTSPYFNDAVNRGIQQGAVNIQWVGGEPTIHIPAIVDVMSHCPNLPPVVFKSDFHCTPEALAMLDGAVDVYIADLKFGNDACAKRIAGIDNYFNIVTRNLFIARLQARLIVRHLLLPGHEACCYRPIVQWMQENMTDVPFSLRDSYMPSWRSQNFIELNKPLSRDSGKAAAHIARQAGLRVIQ